MNKFLVMTTATIQAYVFFPLIAKATVPTGLNEAGTALNTAAGTALSGASDLPTLVGRVISILLGFLGIICIGLIVYAGVLYLTAGGDDKHIEKAKKLLTNAAIGLILIVAAYAIATYVVGALSEVATG